MRPDWTDLGKRQSSWLVVLFFIGLLPNSAFADPLEYRLQPGDVIEVRVAGMPDLNQRVPVELDGSIAIAAAGILSVKGETVSEMRSQVQTAFASRLLPSIGAEASQPRSVSRDAVAVSVVEYRPVWASGDVNSPGPHPYSSQMTVRQLLAAAGGVLRPEQLAKSSGYDPLALGGLYRETWLELAGLAARSWRLKAELGEAGEWNPAVLPNSPFSTDELAPIVDGEREIRRTREGDREREKSFLERSIQSGKQEIAGLEEQVQAAIENEAADEAEYARTKELLDKGTVTNSRLVDARRVALYSFSRRLEVQVELMRLQRRLTEDERRLESATNDWRSQAREELQTIETKRGEAAAKLQDIVAKMHAAGGVLTGRDAVVPKLLLIRQVGDISRIYEPDLDDRLVPGDVIEVQLDQDRGEGVSPLALEHY